MKLDVRPEADEKKEDAYEGIGYESATINSLLSMLMEGRDIEWEKIPKLNNVQLINYLRDKGLFEKLDKDKVNLNASSILNIIWDLPIPYNLRIAMTMSLGDFLAYRRKVIEDKQQTDLMDLIKKLEKKGKVIEIDPKRVDQKNIIDFLRKILGEDK